jgi:hypothetical protein
VGAEAVEQAGAVLHGPGLVTLGTDAEQLDDLGGVLERVGDDPAVLEPDGRDGAPGDLGEDRAAAERTHGVEGGEPAKGGIVGRPVGAQDHLVQLGVHDAGLQFFFRGSTIVRPEGQKIK